MGNNIYSRKQIWKSLLLFFAILIGAGSLYYTNQLVKKISSEERKKVKLWAEATRQLGSQESANQDIDFLVKIIRDNETVPVILMDDDGHFISHRNLDSTRSNDEKYLQHQLELMKQKQEPIIIDLGEDKKNYIYYKDSTLLTQLSYYPYIQLAVILIFIMISYYAFSISRRAEQNQVWVGLSRETAHQLGTPTSSLMAWIELMKIKEVEPELVNKMQDDINRLEKITERFSKIGSKPNLKAQSIQPVIKNVQEYLNKRFSSNIHFEMSNQVKNIIVPLNTDLFEWVLENICKNAYDSLQGSGEIKINITPNKKRIYIDVSDNGKGIQKSKHKTIFKPGYTTKKRGWGLGLSLSKRIIEQYHNGKIYVLHSEPGKGTTIRIALPMFAEKT